MAPQEIVRRAGARIIDVTDVGRTAQSDHNRLVLMPHPTDWDPFLLLADDRFSAVGFDWHPHRGFQTLTLVLDGLLEHRDNAGGYGVLAAGDAQFMAAGRYAMHYELAYQRQPVHTLQLWLNLPPELKMMDTSYRDLRGSEAALVEQDGVRARVYVGRAGEVTGIDPAEFPVPFTLIDVELEAGARFEHEVPGEHVVAAYALDGAATIGDDEQELRGGQVAWLEAGDSGASVVAVSATQPSRVVMYSAAPIGAPVALGGPFVMSTQQEIQDAFAEYRAGDFGEVPVGGEPILPA